MTSLFFYLPSLREFPLVIDWAHRWTLTHLSNCPSLIPLIPAQPVTWGRLTSFPTGLGCGEKVLFELEVAMERVYLCAVVGVNMLWENLWLCSSQQNTNTQTQLRSRSCVISSWCSVCVVIVDSWWGRRRGIIGNLFIAVSIWATIVPALIGAQFLFVSRPGY